MGPYYYRLWSLRDYTKKNDDGNDVITFYDSPGGFVDKVDFFTAIVEVNRKCCSRKQGLKVDCYDRVTVIASVSWSYDPATLDFLHGDVQDGYLKRKLMIPTMQKLINSASWATELCSSTKIEVRNER